MLFLEQLRNSRLGKNCYETDTCIQVTIEFLGGSFLVAVSIYLFIENGPSSGTNHMEEE